MATEEVKIVFSADTQKVVDRVDDIYSKIEEINKKKSEGGDIISKQDIENIQVLAKEMDGLGHVLGKEVSDLTSKLTKAQKDLEKAISSNMEEGVIKSIKEHIKQLEAQKKELERILKDNGMQVPQSPSQQGLNWKEMLQNFGEGALGGFKSSGSLMGALSGGASAISKLLPQVALLTVGITALTAVGKKLVQLTKEGAQLDKKGDVYSARISQSTRAFNDDLVRAKAKNLSPYYSETESLQMMDSYASQSGITSIDLLSKDVSSIQNDSLAMGADFNTLASANAGLITSGTYKAGEAQEFDKLATALAEGLGMEAMINDVIDNLVEIKDNTYATQLSMSEQEFENLARYQQEFTQTLGVSGTKGAEIAQAINNAIIGQSSSYNAYTQEIMNRNGWEGYGGLHKAKMQASKGLSDTDNFNAIFDMARNFTGSTDKDILAGYIAEKMGVNDNYADALVKYEDELRKLNPLERDEFMQTKLREEYNMTEDAQFKTIDANVADIATSLGDFYNDFKNGFLSKFLGKDDFENLDKNQTIKDIDHKLATDDTLTEEEKKTLENDKKVLKRKVNPRLKHQYGDTSQQDEYDAVADKYGIDGSHATGLDYVPFDGYRAELHEGEQVLTKQQASERRKGSGGADGEQLNLLLRKEINAKYMETLDKEDTILEKRKGIEENFRKAVEELVNYSGANINIKSKSSGSGSGGAVGGTSSMDISDALNYDLNGASDPTHGLSASQVNAYLNKKTKKGSSMYNQGEAYLQASKESGLDIWYLIAHSAEETGWGSSKISKNKGNMYGIGAFDNSPYKSAYGYDNAGAGIIEGAKWIAKNYANGQYGQDTLYKMRNNGGVHQYATNPEWDDNIANIMQSVAKNLGSGSGGGTTNINVSVNGSGGTKSQNEDLATKTAKKVKEVVDLRYAYKLGK